MNVWEDKLKNHRCFFQGDTLGRQKGKIIIFGCGHFAEKETQRLANKQHEVFEPSFDRKECRTVLFMQQKANYIHLNPCKAGIAAVPEAYVHSSAGYYYTGKQGVYPVITYMELQDIDLGLR